MEIYEFHHLIAEGFGPDRSAFLSSFFALVGTHGLHVTSGLIWIIVLMIQVSKFGLTATNKTRLMCLSLFWHFWTWSGSAYLPLSTCWGYVMSHSSHETSHGGASHGSVKSYGRLYPVDHPDGNSICDGNERHRLSFHHHGGCCRYGGYPVIVHWFTSCT